MIVTHVHLLSISVGCNCLYRSHRHASDITSVTKLTEILSSYIMHLSTE